MPPWGTPAQNMLGVINLPYALAHLSFPKAWTPAHCRFLGSFAADEGGGENKTVKKGRLLVLRPE